LAEAVELIFARVYPKVAFAALAEFYICGKLASIGVESIAMESEVVEKGDGQIDGWGSSGGSRDVVLSFAAEATVFAATVVVAAGDGGGASAAVSGKALARGEGTGGRGSGSDGFA
jgi:hypothetical protein